MSRFTVIISILFVLAGCSSTKFAYQYADRGIVWWVDDYISMTDEQEDQLKQDIRELLDWHCREELPRYTGWLAELKQDVKLGHLHHTRVLYHQEKLLSFAPPLANRAKPAVTRLLSSLSEKQVKKLAENMAESQVKLEDEFLPGDPEQTRQARTARTKKRIERWLGTLNDPQTLILEQWSSNRGRQTEIWLEGRRTWQNELLEALKQRKDRGFGRTVDHLVDNYDEVRGPLYQQMMSESRVSVAGLLTALLDEADQHQLDFLLEKATGLKNDFTDLACSGAGDAPKKMN